MATKSQFQAIRGTRDLLPPETALWNRVEETARQVFATFGFGEIRPPIFEPTQLFARAVGSETDVVSKEMYVFEEQGGGDVVRARENVRNSYFSYEAPNSIEVFAGFLGDLETRIIDGLKTGEIELDEDGRKMHEWFERSVAYFRALISVPVEQRNKAELVRMVELIKGTAPYVPVGRIVSLRPEATASVCRAYI